jgi:hypothetical protein
MASSCIIIVRLYLWSVYLSHIDGQKVYHSSVTIVGQQVYHINVTVLVIGMFIKVV